MITNDRWSERGALHLVLAGVALVLVLSPAARAREVGEGTRSRAESAARGEQQDDPAGRYAAQEQLSEGKAPGWAQLANLRAARRERDKVGVSVAAQGARTARSLSAPVPGNDWINLGPTTADFENNGVVYTAVDSGRLRSIVPHPGDPNILFIATAGGGVWKTYDAGLTWEPLTDRLGSLGSGALAMDPHNPDILVYGFGDPFDPDLQNPGVVTSTDGGANWTNPICLVNHLAGASIDSFDCTTGTLPAKATLVTNIRDLQIDPNNSAHILAATNLGLYTSNDNGGTWTAASFPGGAFSAWSIGWLGGSDWLVSGEALDSTLSIEGALGLFRSTDGGATWTAVAVPGGNASVGRATIAVATGTTSDPTTARVYLLASSAPPAANSAPDFFTRDLFRSDDGGLTFRGLGVNKGGRPTNPNADQQDLNVLHDQSWYNQAIITDPFNPDIVFVGGNLAMIRTIDGGATWSVLTDWLPAGTGIALPYLHADYHAMAATLASGSPVFYIGSDGGLFSSSNINKSGVAVTVSDHLNRGIVSHLTYSVACAPDTFADKLQAFIIGGMQDNGTRERALPALFSGSKAPSGPDSFNQVYGGDGFDVGVSSAIDSTSGLPLIILASTYGGTGQSAMHASTNGGTDFADFSNGVNPKYQPFLLRYATDNAPGGDGQTFLTYTDPTAQGSSDAHVYRIASASISGSWTDISNVVTYPGQTVAKAGFVNYKGAGVSPHFLATNPKHAGFYLMDADGGSTYLTVDAGQHWLAGNPLGSSPAANQTLAIRGTGGLSFDASDPTAMTFYATSVATTLFDVKTPAPDVPVPASFGHVFKTTDGGLNWTSFVGSGSAMLPNVPSEAVQVDPGDSNTVYVGTQLGLYVTHNANDAAGPSFQRMGNGLPLVDVTEICISPASRKIAISTYGRGFWQIDQLSAGGAAGGAHGRGDMNYDQKLDGFDLIDLVAVMGTTNADDAYRQEADLTGSTAAVDDADLALFLQRFGGTP